MNSSLRTREREPYSHNFAPPLPINGISTKFVGGKPLLRWFIEADDPKTLLEDLQNPNGAFSPPAPC